jgi:hypothetical protein
VKNYLESKRMGCHLHTKKRKKRKSENQSLEISPKLNANHKLTSEKLADKKAFDESLFWQELQKLSQTSTSQNLTSRHGFTKA